MTKPITYICCILSSRSMFRDNKNSNLWVPVRKNILWVKSTPNTWHRCAQIEKKGGYQELQSKHVPSVNKPLKTQIGTVHTSLFSSHHPVFPALVPVPASFPQSGRHRSVPLALSALCSLAKQREVTAKMAKTQGPRAQSKQAAPQRWRSPW